MGAPLTDLVGKTFHRFTVIKFLGSENNNRLWECRCSCGTIKTLNTKKIMAGNTRSCGCLVKEKSRLNAIKYSTTHGLSKNDDGSATRLYTIWLGMKRRCYSKLSKSYKTYGALDIKVCDEWKNSYLNFYTWAISNGYNDNLTIERRNFNGDYAPENCTWIPNSEQAKNRRNNIYLNVDGEVLTIAECARRKNISRATLKYRISHGYNLNDALNKPINQQS
jgi:hypothetical protein